MFNYFFFRITVFLFWLLPFRVIYLLSDGMAWVMRVVVKYRYNVIETNLKKSFPNKSKSEIQTLIKGSYQNLCDCILEGIKGMSLSKKEIIRRCKVTNPEVADAFAREGRSVILVASHFGNFEWATQIGLQLEHLILGIYKPLRNPRTDAYLKRTRQNKNFVLIPNKETYKELPNHIHQPCMVVLIADQSPSNSEKAHWLTFLNQETAFLKGPDAIAREYNFPVIYADLQRVNRGFYTLTFIVLEDQPNSLPEKEITKVFRNELTRIILAQPENWLWSHKRWKKKRPSHITID